MSDDDLIQASPCKLRNGNWGCKTSQAVAVGDTVRIVTRANKQWRAEITQIVWTGDDVWICETASQNSREAGAAPAASKPAATPPAADAPAPPSMPAAPPDDDLDAMADRAAADDADFDTLMSAAEERERDGD